MKSLPLCGIRIMPCRAMLIYVTAAVVAAGAARAEEAAFSSLHSVEKTLWILTNAERIKQGLEPLPLDTKLMDSAREHAAWMTDNHTLEHTSKQVAENIAMGQTSSAEAVREWMASPGHRANILNPRYKRIGVAAYSAKDGVVFWCQQFLE